MNLKLNFAEISAKLAGQYKKNISSWLVLMFSLKDFAEISAKLAGQYNKCFKLVGADVLS